MMVIPPMDNFRPLSSGVARPEYGCRAAKHERVQDGLGYHEIIRSKGHFLKARLPIPGSIQMCYCHTLEAVGEGTWKGTDTYIAAISTPRFHDRDLYRLQH
jgi:hypothetical protein